MTEQTNRHPFLWHVRHSVRRPDECWPWTGYHLPNGYPTVTIRGRTVPAYRAVWELLVGPIPSGHELDHTCRNPSCVNPHHLEAVPPRTNNMRSDSPAAQNHRKTHCVHGHPFDHDNTCWVRRSNGKVDRKCRTCNRLRQRQIAARR